LAIKPTSKRVALLRKASIEVFSLIRLCLLIKVKPFRTVLIGKTAVARPWVEAYSEITLRRKKEGEVNE